MLVVKGCQFRLFPYSIDDSLLNLSSFILLKFYFVA